MKGAGRVKRVFRRLRRQFRPGAVVLLYHRVVSLPADPHSLAVSPSRFAQHLQYINQTCHPMRLVDLVEAVKQRSIPHRAAAITFDDGYSDNFIGAYPLLKSAGIPATIFVTSEQIGSPCEFWWDDLERLLLLPEHLPEHLQICIDGIEYERRLNSPDARQRAYQELHKHLKPLAAYARNKILDELTSWADLEPEGRIDYRAVTASELVELAQSEYIDIGAHTRTHPKLSALSVDAQYAEIVGGRQRLETIIGGQVATFAYPYGTSQDFTDETTEIVRAAGFMAACTTTPGSLEAGDDLFRLRRCPIFDWPLETFKQQLELCFIA
jgi:peptidoglycan/xylan/chitin deacetylase (PgdA/CDA1 family)